MTNFPLEQLDNLCADFGVEITDEIKTQLNTYGNLLIEWNEKINLTAITEPNEVVIKHFYDCILFLKRVDIPRGATVIDVGTGAGFPGIVLKIMRPDISLTLLDALNKRLVFLNEVLKALNLDARLLHSRAEDAGKDTAHREQYDIACARAVARLSALCEYCLPLVKIGGQLVAMKGPSAMQELDEAQNAIQLLGGGKSEIFVDTLTGDETRHFINIKKISQTPSKYPRKGVKISKQPL